jgi:hypothetical protein
MPVPPPLKLRRMLFCTRTDPACVKSTTTPSSTPVPPMSSLSSMTMLSGPVLAMSTPLIK